MEQENKNIDSINLKETPEYELKFVNRTLKIDTEEIANEIKEDLEITYKYYEIAINNNSIESVNTMDEAEELINQIKDSDEKLSEDQEMNLSIVEKYTEKEDEINTTDIEVAKANIGEKVSNKIEEERIQKEEQERQNAMPQINGIRLAVKPVSGTISSRYGVSSRIRKSTHTGLDIAAPTGTPIKVISDGTVTNASYNGSYGNLVKVDHGNGVETWYAHTSKMYVKVGEKVKAGDVIAAVGSTGNSTGAHLHLEIRINGSHVDPQNYMYK